LRKFPRDRPVPQLKSIWAKRRLVDKHVNTVVQRVCRECPLTELMELHLSLAGDGGKGDCYFVVVTSLNRFISNAALWALLRELPTFLRVMRLLNIDHEKLQ
jgi:hypothetical protein